MLCGNQSAPIREPDDLELFEDAEEDEDVLPSIKPRKISERKRRMNAIADNYIQEIAQKSFKQDTQNERQKLEDQSARYIVNQAESQKIISTPREYQTELFERAKEKNIIAVLDTGTLLLKTSQSQADRQGSGKTLIAVLLLRHIFGQELEDRAIGKPKRLSFFLVGQCPIPAEFASYESLGKFRHPCIPATRRFEGQPGPTHGHVLWRYEY
jgi:endoribonuclease Dicer